MNCRLLLWLVLAGLGLLGSSCRHDLFYEPVFLISLHEFAPEELHGSQLAYGVRDPLDTQRYMIKRYAFLDARRIARAELLPGRNSRRSGLRIYPDRYGMAELMQLANRHKGDEYAVIVDGFYVGRGRFPPRLPEDGALMLEELWSEPEAERVQEAAGRNYRRLNR